MTPKNCLMVTILEDNTINGPFPGGVLLRQAFYIDSL
jgi:hypothetical protein